MDKVTSFLETHRFLNYKENESLAKHSYIRAGGLAKLLFTPEDIDQLLTTIGFLREEGIPYKVIGRGSNLLFSDAPYEGVIIKNTKALQHQTLGDEEIVVGSSASLVKLSVDLARAGLSGLEFIHGIPGSVGGALYMNAGAYNKEMKDVLISMKILDEDGEVKELPVEACGYRYRHSIFKETPQPPLILEGRFQVTKGDVEEIQALMKKRKDRRVNAQPLDRPSCGSVFKNPEGTHAWVLIDKAGLRGHRIGGAHISTKHCNFIINDQDAKASDVKALIDLAEKRVFEACGVKLEREVEFFNF